MIALALLAVLLLAAWIVLVAAFKITVGAIHLLLIAGLVLGAIALFRRLSPSHQRTHA